MKNRDGYWVIRTYTAGNVGEKTKFWIPGERPKKVNRRTRSDLRKIEQNEWSAVKAVARLINANFKAEDLIIGLDYSEKGMRKLIDASFKYDDDNVMDRIRHAAEHELVLCLRRVKRELARDGVELKYIAFTSDMDGETGEAVRVHHHLIINAEAQAAFVSKWQALGGVDWSYLSVQADYTPVAQYFIRQVRKLPDAKKYFTSRNLIRPQPKDRIVNSGAELRVPQGGQLLYRNAYSPGQSQYIRYILPGSGVRTHAHVISTGPPVI